jgi:monoamine oxidase
MAEARRLYPDFDVTRTWDIPKVPVAPEDEPFDAYLKRIGFSDAQLYYVRRMWGNAEGDDISRVTAIGALQEIFDASNGNHIDFRVIDGYDRVPKFLAEGVDVRLNTTVESIQWDSAPVVVTTRGGETFRADRVLITVPLGVLQKRSIRFVPELPAEKLNAIDKLVMGPALKLIYRFDQPVLPEGIGALYSAINPPMWWSPSYGHDTNVTVMTAFITGDWARQLHAEGQEAALEHGFNTLQSELGRKLPYPQAAMWVNWIDDPFAFGGYSVAPPGALSAREDLAQPLEHRLYWAGEATAPHPWASTVHGAYASGRRAAAEILVSLDK